MKGLILLYWGTVFLMYLSQTYYPVETQLDGRQTGKRHFMLRSADIFMIIIIAWIACFSFLRVNYNDTVNYIYDFLNLTDPLEQFLSDFNLLRVGDNPLFNLYQTIIYALTDNYHILFLFPALFNSISVV